MARWHIGGQGWPVNGGLRLIPASTLISDDGDPSAIPLKELPLPLPIDAISLDADALAQMKAWYPVEHHHRLLYGPDVGKTPQTTSGASSPKKQSSAKGPDDAESETDPIEADAQTPTEAAPGSQRRVGAGRPAKRR